MKSFYTLFSKLLLCGLFAMIGQTTSAQLVKGDIAFTGYISINVGGVSDQFSFVLLTNVPNGTAINFTDNAWLRTSSTTGSFRTGEGTLTFTTNANFPAGVEIKIVMTSTTAGVATIAGSGASAGTITGTNMPDLSATGDQLIAYQGTAAAPTFISAIHLNVYNNAIAAEPITSTTDWDGSYSTANACGLPALTSVGATNFLTNGTNALWLPGSITTESKNARFNCTGPLTTVAQVRAAVYNVANWTQDVSTTATASFTLPTDCNYLNILLPVQLMSFQAKSNLTDVVVQWKVANQQNVSHYDVERSLDNKNFDKAGTVAAQAGSGDLTYNYTDAEGLKNSAAVIYYRLKSVDLDGKFAYSEIVSIRNKNGATLAVDNMTNPVKNNLNFTLVSKNGGKVQVQLTDVNGKILATRSLQVTAGSSTTVNMPEVAALAQGIYLLKLSTDSETIVNRFVK